MSRKQPDAAPQPPGRLDDYAAQVLRERLTKMLSHVEGVRQQEGTGPVHQMRVWSRRSRAALDIFQPCFSGKAYRKLEREVKEVTRALGAARDLDVMIETLGKRAEELPPEQRGGVESLRETLRAQRAALQKPVVKSLKRLESHDLLALFEKSAARSGSAQQAAGAAQDDSKIVDGSESPENAGGNGANASPKEGHG